MHLAEMRMCSNTKRDKVFARVRRRPTDALIQRAELINIGQVK